ncbi:MAG TPA: hypothetical protein VK543_09075 [Puia sp.]|nr:hypothetical protein [Puia sp.]
MRIFEFLLKDDGIFPNSTLPALIYLQAFEQAAPSVMERIFESNDWSNSWRDSIYPYHHYHSITHEVLGIYEGACDLILGGDHGVSCTVKAGDAIIIPAGVAHKNLSATENFKCIGAYPEGKSFDINYGRIGERPGTDKNIANVPLPDTDPVFGPEGNLLNFWSVKVTPAH